MTRLALLLTVAIAALAPAAQASQPVAQVTTLEVPAEHVDAYVAALKKLVPILRKHSPKSSTRIWQNTVAGSDTGRIVVVVEFPNMVAWAERGPKMNADPEYHEALKRFAGMGRKVLSVVLMTEQ